ncbi:MAG: hypothetical protein ACQET5_12755 [Halobacteriota archaeon]|uniref:hypothetical protein n=1 Tax=Natronomonas sp. TaxID=2184060 RepID=UPI003976E8AF
MPPRDVRRRPIAEVTAIHFTDRGPDLPADVAIPEIESRSGKHAFEIETVVKGLSKRIKRSVRDGIIDETQARDGVPVVLGDELSSVFHSARRRRVGDRLLGECGVTRRSLRARWRPSIGA